MTFVLVHRDRVRLALLSAFMFPIFIQFNPEAFSKIYARPSLIDNSEFIGKGIRIVMFLERKLTNIYSTSTTSHAL